MENHLTTPERIETRIFWIRGKKVMLDFDLAVLYAVETKQLKRQVRRNITRFPADFMFELTQEEYRDFLRRQIGTLKRGRHSKYPPFAFTEPGVAMLSTVLNSERAIQVNIEIIRTFIRLRKMLSSYADLKQKIEDMEAKYDGQFKLVFEALYKLIEVQEKPQPKIGFKK